jgi:superfamily II DNA or RNA helicase
MLNTLRTYQESALKYRLHSERINENVCLQLPTGAGKSEIIKHEVAFYRSQGLKSLIVAPNRRLVHNLAKQIPDAATAHAGVIPVCSKSVLISTVQSAARYIEAFKPDRLISDECHHTASATAQKITALANCPHTGYTATPNRLDGQGLYKWFQHLWEAPQIGWFINQGYLADYELYQAKAPLFEAKTDALDLQEKIMLPEIHTLVAMYHAYCKHDKTIIYATTIKHGELICEALKQTGIKAAFLSSKSSHADQDFYFKAFQNGLITCLVNVELFTEGVDVPDAQTVILARFCYSTALYLQCTGRILRPYPGKLAKIIDLVGLTYYHGQPKNSFYWSLEGDLSARMFAVNNQSSQYIYCDECQATLTHKRYIAEKAVIACLNCQNEVYAFPIVKSNVGSKFLHSVFEVSELIKVTDLQTTALTRILQNKHSKYSSTAKKITAVMALGLEVTLLRKVLKYLKMSEKTIAFYIED